MFIVALALIFTLSVLLVRGEDLKLKKEIQKINAEGRLNLHYITSEPQLQYVSRELLSDASEQAIIRENRKLNCVCGEIAKTKPITACCFCVEDGHCSSGSICFGNKQSWCNCVTGSCGCCHKIPKKAKLPVVPGFMS